MTDIIRDAIRMGDDPILTEVCRSFDFTAPTADAAALALAARLRFMLDDRRALGVAAPQIGEATRAFVIRERRAAIVCFNPAIVLRCDGEAKATERCLSFPDVAIEVRRARAVTGRYQCELGLWRERLFEGETARAFQHELDHLDGVTLRERVPAHVWTQAMLAASIRAIGREAAQALQSRPATAFPF